MTSYSTAFNLMNMHSVIVVCKIKTFLPGTPVRWIQKLQKQSKGLNLHVKQTVPFHLPLLFAMSLFSLDDPSPCFEFVCTILRLYEHVRGNFALPKHEISFLTFVKHKVNTKIIFKFCVSSLSKMEIL